MVELYLEYDVLDLLHTHALRMGACAEECWLGAPSLIGRISSLVENAGSQEMICAWPQQLRLAPGLRVR